MFIFLWAPAVARSVNWGHSTTSSCAMPPRCAMPPPEHSRDTVRARCSAEAAASAGPHCPGSRLAARPGPASRAFTQDSFELKVLETTLLAWHSGVLPPVSQSQTQSVLGLFLQTAAVARRALPPHRARPRPPLPGSWYIWTWSIESTIYEREVGVTRRSHGSHTRAQAQQRGAGANEKETKRKRA